MNQEIINSLSLKEKDRILLEIINLYNTIKDKNKQFDDSHHEIADTIIKIFEGK